VIPQRRGNNSTRRDVLEIFELCEYLDSLQVYETFSSGNQCQTCFQTMVFSLDEGMILLPFPAGAFHGRTNLCGNIHPRQGGGLIALRTGPRSFDESGYFRYASYTPYMIIQDIVRSGMFTEKQLRGAGRFSHLFSRHELEVNAKAFSLVRPERCGNCYHTGSVFSYQNRLNFDLGFDIYGYSQPHVAEPSQETVDTLHAAGKRIRTGFRIRSRAALARRRHKRVVKPTQYCLHGDCINDSSLKIEVKLLYTPHGVDLRRCKRFGNVLSRFYRRKETRFRGHRPRVYVPNCVPFAHHSKYWYFLRTRGAYVTSVHHPHVDDYLYLGL